MTWKRTGPGALRAAERLAAACAGAAVLAGCLAAGSPRAAPAPPRVPEVPSIESFSRNPFQSVSLPPNPIHTHEQAMSALGRPTQTVVRNVPDQYDPALVHTLITLRYPFGELVYLRVAEKGLENLILITLTGNQVPLKFAVRIGRTTREQILETFGPPEQNGRDFLVYAVSGTQEITNSTTFFFSGGTLSRVDISSLMLD